VKGNSLIIGNEEFFRKKNKSLELKITWKDLLQKPANVDYDKKDEGIKFPQVEISYLKKGGWVNLKSNVEIFDEVSGAMQQSINLFDALEPLNESFVDYSEDYPVFSNASKSGFIKLTLQKGFGHKKFIDAKTEYLIDKANDKSPTEP